MHCRSVLKNLRKWPITGMRNHSVLNKSKIINNEEIDIKDEVIRSFKEIPGPKALPLIGNVFRFFPYVGKSN